MVNMSFWSSAVSSLGEFISSTADVVHSRADLVYRKGVSDFIASSGGTFTTVTDLSFLKDMEKSCKLSLSAYDYEDFFRSVSAGAEVELLNSSPVCFTYFEPSDNTLYVVCRGTSGFLDAAVDYSWLLDTKSIHDTDVRIPAIAASIVEHIMREDNLPAVIDRLKTKPISRIVFTGHSLGGAIASALYIFRSLHPSEQHSIPSHVFTFGSPLVTVASKDYSRMSTSELRSAISKLGLTSKSAAFTEKSEFIELLRQNEPVKRSGALGMQNVDISRVHHIIFQLDVVPRLVGPHPLPEVIINSDIGKRLLSFVESHDTKREDYCSWGRFYALHRPVERERPVLEEAQDPNALLSLFPQLLVSLPLSIADHNLRLGYLKSIRDILSPDDSSLEVD